MELQRWLVPQVAGENRHAGLITVAGGARPVITILGTEERVPWSGHSARYAMADVYEAIKAHRTTLLFVNTRSQAELLFQELWTINDDNLPIAPASRLAGCRPAPQGGGGDEREQAARRRCHLHARPRHRLGRCRSRHPCRRAQGRLAAGAAHRPLQPPHGRAEPGDPGARQPLRGDGVPGSPRRQLYRRAGHPRRSAPGRWTCWPSMCSARPVPLPFQRRRCLRR